MIKTCTILSPLTSTSLYKCKSGLVEKLKIAHDDHRKFHSIMSYNEE